MANWVTVSEDDLNDTKVAKLVTALRTKALAAGQTDPSERVIASVVTDIRRKIASCRNNQVDADLTTIPASLVPLATDMILARLKGRLELELTKFEEDQLSTHRETLNRIAACTDVVEQPDAAIAAPTQSTAGTPSISDTRATERRARRSGL
jgi:hypothetical protein